MDTMGRVYRKLGLYEPARELLEGALRLTARHWETTILLIAQSLHNLANLLHDMGKEAEAEPMIREALSSNEKRGPRGISTMPVV